MICEICKKNPAKIHVTQVRDGNKTTIHICSECAHEKGVAGPAINTAFSIEQVLGEFAKISPGEDSTAAEKRICTACGITFNAFKESGRLGCAVCYDSFTDELFPLLMKVQKDIRHTGKVTHQGNVKLNLKRVITDMRKQLKIAVDEENFEEAARLRDQIRTEERKLIQHESKEKV